MVKSEGTGKICGRRPGECGGEGDKFDFQTGVTVSKVDQNETVHEGEDCPLERKGYTENS